MSQKPHILSLGAGVQSSTLALMAAVGAVKPMPIAAVFADTQAEPASVYAWLAWLEKQLPFPVIRATKGSLTDDSSRLVLSKRSGLTYLKTRVPYYFLTGENKKGMNQRHCTRDYKIDVIRRETKKIMKAAGAKSCYQWIGISTDEAVRMKPSGDPRFENLWPLIEANVSRKQCLEWMERRGYPKPPRSACTFCPYHSDVEWKRLRDEEPEAFEHAVAYEKRLSAAVGQATAVSFNAAFLHASRVPLDQVVFKDDASKPSAFGNECEGMCGV